MKKTILTVFAFFVIFGFAISGAMAQTWTWSDPALISNATMYRISGDPAFEVLNGLMRYSTNCTACHSAGTLE